MRQYEKNKFSILLVFSCFILAVFLLPLAAAGQATEKTAKVYFLPSSGTFSVGQAFSVRTAVDTGGQAINAVEDTISFSNDTLEVENLAKTGTILTLWVKEPIYDNSSGQIIFVGGVPNPGFTGIGHLFIINFKAKAEGSGWVKFNAAQVLANDGFGTNITSSIGRADYTIEKPALPPPVPVKPPVVPPIVPPIELKSATHPDPDVWYAKRDVIFTWTWQSGVKDYSYIFDRKSDTVPDDIGEGLDTSISYIDVEDGVWYFHIRAKIYRGWADAAHFKVRIDATPPYGLKIVFDEELPTRNPSPSFKIEVKDDTSGVEYYEVKVDQEDVVRIEEPEYKIPTLRPGGHQVLVRAYDKAGNFAEDSLAFKILPLLPPKITYWTKQILFDEPLLIKGETIPQAKINIIINGEVLKEPLMLTTESDEKGEWFLKYKELFKKGEYKFWATAETKAGAVSPPSEEKTFEVLANAVRIFGFILPASVLGGLIVFLLAVIAGLVVIILFFRRKFEKCDIVLRKFAVRLTRRGHKIEVKEE